MDRYEEALERARKVYNNEAASPARKQMLAGIFPELAESEDEKIRKHIIKILDSLAACHWDGNEKSRCIAYLEKQKEPSTPEEKMKHSLYVEGFEVGKQVGAQYEAVFGKQKEQKPAEWSEEDEEIRRIIINRLTKFDEWASKQGYTRDDPGLRINPIDWFKSLRPNWKPSEEQMKALYEATNLLAYNGKETHPLRSLHKELQALL